MPAGHRGSVAHQSGSLQGVVRADPEVVPSSYPNARRGSLTSVRLNPLAGVAIAVAAWNPPGLVEHRKRWNNSGSNQKVMKNRDGRRQQTKVHQRAPIGVPHVEIAGRVLLPILVAAVPACGPGNDDSRTTVHPGASSPGASEAGDRSVDMVTFAEAFEVVDTLVLEETDEAMVVQPMVTSDDTGMLLATEPMEAQVNLFTTDGTLLRTLGTKGDGPGEFLFPLTAHRTRNGEVVVADVMAQRLTFFKAGHDSTPEAVPAPVPGIMSAQDLGGGRYLLAGANPSETPPRLLHIWNRESRELERSFLPMGVPDASLPFATSFSAASATLDGDTIWAVWALSDTLYKFDRTGERLAAWPLSLARPMGELPTSDRPVTDPREVQRVFDSMTQVYKAFVMEDGEKVVVSMQTREFGSVWDILILDSHGETVWRAANMPRLLAVSQGAFYFRDPDSVLPNHWIVARRRSDV